MKQTTHSSLLLVASFATFISFAVVQPSGAADPLNPSGPPAPTGKSLREISDQVADVKSCLSDICLCDGGTFLVIGTNRSLAAWKPETGTWTTMQASTVVASTTSSEGNYLVVDESRRAYAWSRETGTWQDIVLDGTVSKILGSEGNFAIQTSTNRVYSWAYKSGTWSQLQIESGIASFQASP